ncbi:MAG: GMC oxidoreductase, partial [Alphaproteobacteria bacterium]
AGAALGTAPAVTPPRRHLPHGQRRRGGGGAELEVHGVDGLRPADASLMPETTAAKTNAPALLTGWKAAETMRAAMG